MVLDDVMGAVRTGPEEERVARVDDGSRDGLARDSEGWKNSSMLAADASRGRESNDKKRIVKMMRSLYITNDVVVAMY
jgi:hypothetical protein